MFDYPNSRRYVVASDAYKQSHNSFHTNNMAIRDFQLGLPIRLDGLLATMGEEDLIH